MFLINGFNPEGEVTINRVILKPEYSVDELEMRVVELCENVKAYHSDAGFVGGFVAMNSGIGQAVTSPLNDREALIVTFWQSFEDHERSHRSETFQTLFMRVLELCENGNEEIRSQAYSPEEAVAAIEAIERFNAAS